MSLRFKPAPMGRPRPRSDPRAVRVRHRTTRRRRPPSATACPSSPRSASPRTARRARPTARSSRPSSPSGRTSTTTRRSSSRSPTTARRSRRADVVGGYEADVVALSLGPDVDEIADAGLITHDWTTEPDGGMVTTSVVVFDVRPGNPLGIEDWDDLTTSGVEVLTPDPASSGGARWNLVSAWGSALRGYGGVTEDDEAGATTLMQGVLGNVVAFDSSARKSIQNFEDGNGDVAITYENEVLTAQAAGQGGRGRLPAVERADREPGRGRGPERRQALRPRGRRGVRRVSSTRDEAKEIYADVGLPLDRSGRPRRRAAATSRRSRTSGTSTSSAAGTR